MTLLLRGQAHFDQCFDTPTSATTLLLHGKTRSDQCYDTPASAKALLLCRQTCSIQYCTIPSGTYCTMSFSFSISGLCRKILICYILE